MLLNVFYLITNQKFQQLDLMVLIYYEKHSNHKTIHLPEQIPSEDLNNKYDNTFQHNDHILIIYYDYFLHYIHSKNYLHLIIQNQFHSLFIILFFLP